MSAKDEARDPARDALAEIVNGEQAHLPFHLRCEIMVRAARWVDTAVAEARAPLVEALEGIRGYVEDNCDLRTAYCTEPDLVEIHKMAAAALAEKGETE